MESTSKLVKVSLANYIANLPIPESFLGWFSIGLGGWLRLVPFFSVIGGVSYVTYRFVVPKSPCNPKFKKDVPKIVDSLEIEDLADKTSFCRCWRSSKFPYCDGAHNSYNLTSGDNVGPLIIKKQKD